MEEGGGSGMQTQTACASLPPNAANNILMSSCLHLFCCALLQGDSIHVRMSPNPVPTINNADQVRRHPVGSAAARCRHSHTHARSRRHLLGHVVNAAAWPCLPACMPACIHAHSIFLHPGQLPGVGG